MCTKQPTKSETYDQQPIKSECVHWCMRCEYDLIQSSVCVCVCLCGGGGLGVRVCTEPGMHGCENSNTGVCMCMDLST